MKYKLLLPDEDIDGRTCQLPVLTNLILQEPLVGLFHILWQIGIEHKSGNITSLSFVVPIFTLRFR